jgi:hypothetical protein
MPRSFIMTYGAEKMSEFTPPPPIKKAFAPAIWLKGEEDAGEVEVARCGCTLWDSGPEGEGGASFYFCDLHEWGELLYKALREARRKWGRLHDVISDMVEDGKISAELYPDDFNAVVDALTRGGEAEKAARNALSKARRQKAGEPNLFA